MSAPSRPRPLATLLLVATTLWGGAPLAGQQDEPEESPSSEGALFLLLPLGARGVALGRAVTALPGPEAVWWNPAGLGEVEDAQLAVFRRDDAVGEATAASLVLASPGLGSLGFSYHLLDLGDQDLRDAEGNVLGSVSARNHLGVVTAATRFSDRVSAGVNLKVVQARVACRGQCEDPGVTSTTYAVDAGVQVSGPDALPLRVGAMIANAGPDLQVKNEEQADPLPTRIRISVAYELLHHFVATEELSLGVAVELEDRLRERGNPATYLGTELKAGRNDLFSLRAGYVFGSDLQIDGAAVGLGLRYERIDLSLAKSLASSSLAGGQEPVHVSFGFVL